MPRRSCPVSQIAITRLIKAAIAAGVGKEHIVVQLTRDSATMRFSEQPVEDAKSPVADALEVTDDSWSDVNAS